MNEKLSNNVTSLAVQLIYLFIFISLTTKGKVSTEGNEAYRGVTYKKGTHTNISTENKTATKAKVQNNYIQGQQKINLLNRTQKVIQ